MRLSHYNWKQEPSPKGTHEPAWLGGKGDQLTTAKKIKIWQC